MALVNINPDGNDEYVGDTHDTDPAAGPWECDHCGSYVFTLTEVEYADPSVGYRGVIQVCPKCIEEVR